MKERSLRRLKEFVRTHAPEPDVLRIVGEELRRKGTDKLTSWEIDRIIEASRGFQPR